MPSANTVRLGACMKVSKKRIVQKGESSERGLSKKKQSYLWPQRSIAHTILSSPRNEILTRKEGKAGKKGSCRKKSPLVGGGRGNLDHLSLYVRSFTGWERKKGKGRRKREKKEERSPRSKVEKGTTLDRQ